MFLRSFLLSLLTLLLSIPAKAQDDVILVKCGNWGETPTEVGRLYPQGGNKYAASTTIHDLVSFEYNGKTYKSEKWINFYDSQPAGQTYSFSTSGNQNLYAPSATYKIQATLSADKQTLSVEFLTPDPPKPLSAIIGSKKVTLTDDAAGSSATFSYSRSIDATKTAVKIESITFDGQTYGPQTTPSFTGSTDSQTCKLALSPGNYNSITLSVSGYYDLSVRTVSGIPVELTLRKLAASEQPNIPARPATLSSTFPESMLDCANSAAYNPSEPLTLWTNKESYKQNIEVGNFGAQYNNVYLLGNGRLGLATECNQTENLLINEKTNYDSNPDPSHNYVSTGTYCPIGFLSIKRDSEEPKYGATFLRQLDLSTAVASAINKWQDGNIEKIYTREYLISNPDQVAVLHFTTNGNVKLSYSFSSSLSGSCTDGLFSATTGNTSNCAIRYNLSFKVIQTGGQLSSSGSTISVTDADNITVVLTVATNYDIDSPTFYSGESDDQLAARAKSTVETAAALGWQKLYDNHIAEYSPLFNASRFELTDAVNNTPTTDLKQHYDDAYNSSGADSDDQTRMIDMLLFAMGRYLNLASSRGSLALPSNLQGIWANQGPQWNCDFHANINLQMNYWAAEPTNISAAHMPFLNYLKKMAATQWRGYADKIVPGTGGWTHHFATNTFGASGQYNGNYSAGAAWNCTHIWQHYLYTQDRQFLADFFDTLYGAARFFFAYLTDTDGDGLLEVPETYSPELTGGSTVAVHSQQLVYQHLCNTRDAALILGKTTEADLCQSYISRMYTGIDIRNGQQCEWKGTLTSEPTHRHLSHIMCLYPLAQVSPYDTDRTNFEGSYAALLTRADADGGEDAAWNTAWKMACYARCLEGDLALRQLAYGMKERFTPDLRTTCKHTFQIEGGAGVSAAIAEMLMQSYSGVIDILPALPSTWPTGSVKGLKAVGNYEVGISWEDGCITELSITDCLNPTIREGGVRLRLHASTIPQSDITGLYINGLPLHPSRAGATYTYEPLTDSYIVSIPAGSPADSKVTFGPSVSTGIDLPTVTEPELTDAPVELFDLQGRRVTAADPLPGIYIRRQAANVTKIRIN